MSTLSAVADLHISKTKPTSSAPTPPSESSPVTITQPSPSVVDLSEPEINPEDVRKIILFDKNELFSWSKFYLLIQHAEKLQSFISTVPMSFINPPRPGKKLLVLDLDHTLLDFTRKEVTT